MKVLINFIYKYISIISDIIYITDDIKMQQWWFYDGFGLKSV